MSDQEEEMCFEGMKPVNQTSASNKGLRGLLHPQQLHLLSRQLEDPDGSFSNGVLRAQTLPSQPTVIENGVLACDILSEYWFEASLIFLFSSLFSSVIQSHQLNFILPLCLFHGVL
jgi:hypothetical protein